MGSALVVVNPAARRGGAGRSWPRLEARIRRHLPEPAIVFTEGPGDATRLVRAGLDRGIDHVVAVGGDGTVNEALNGFVADDAGAAGVTLSPIPAGTANELCRALGLLRDGEAAFQALGGAERRVIDMIRVECTGLDGRPVRRYGYLTASFGAAAG